MKMIKHVILIIIVIFIVLGIPALLYADIPALFAVRGADAVSSATFEIPDRPSGDFIVLMNTDRHSDTTDKWQMFFEGKDAGVIMEDIDCMVIDYDVTGSGLADNLKARLPENQMTVKKESSIMLASKAESGLFDCIITSKEFFDLFRLDTVTKKDNVLMIETKGD